MSNNVLKNAILFLGGYKLASTMNSVALKYGADMLDGTVFGDSTHTKVGGLKTVSLSGKGFFDSTFDAVLKADVGASDVITVGPTSGTAGDSCYLFKDALSQYDLGGAVGSLFPYSIGAETQSDLVRGVLLANETGVTGDGTGSGFVVAAVAAGQSLSAALHLFAISGGGDLTVTVESDVDNTFSSPATVGTFTALAAIGSDWLEVGTANTDTYYRITWTLTGATPSADFAVSAGVH